MLAGALLALVLLAAPAAWALEVTLVATVETPARPVVKGTTNLPDGSVLTVTVSRPDLDFATSATASVRDGHFMAGPFSHDGHDLDAGDYKVDVRMEVTAQPREVLRVVGRHGMQMQGPLLQQGSSGQFVAYSLGFTSTHTSDEPHATQSPAAESWVVESCQTRLEFLNGRIRAKAVSGHEIIGAERESWLADCITQAARIPDSSMQPP